MGELYSLRCENATGGAAKELVSEEEPTAGWAMACNRAGHALVGRGGCACRVAMD